MNDTQLGQTEFLSVAQLLLWKVSLLMAGSGTR